MTANNFLKDGLNAKQIMDLLRAPDTSVLENYFLYFSSKTYVVGTQKKTSQ